MIQGIGTDVFLALAAFHDRFRAKALDIIISHRGNGSIAVESTLRLHFDDAVLQQLQLVLVDIQAFDNVLVALDHLCRGKAARHARISSVVFNLVGDGMDANMAALIKLQREHAANERELMEQKNKLLDIIAEQQKQIADLTNLLFKLRHQPMDVGYTCSMVSEQTPER